MSRTLLVVDDAMIIREMIKDTAIQARWEIVAEAENGKEAVERYSEHQPDAVTLDLVMPEYDGLFALTNIIEDDPDAKVLVVSALDQEQTLKEAFRLGASDFIVKPFDPDILVDTLAKLVI